MYTYMVCIMSMYDKGCDKGIRGLHDSFLDWWHVPHRGMIPQGAPHTNEDHPVWRSMPAMIVGAVVVGSPATQARSTTVALVGGDGHSN